MRVAHSTSLDEHSYSENKLQVTTPRPVFKFVLKRFFKMNAVLHVTISLFFLLGAISQVYSNPRPLHSQVVDNVHGDEMSQNENSVDSYKIVKASWSRSCTFYDYKEECHNTNDGCPEHTVECPTSHYGQRRACYTLWKEGKKLLQGCWAAAQRCGRECIGAPLSRNLNFCCCYGDNCNERYGLQNDIPSSVRQ